jgi:hypothetical protein
VDQYILRSQLQSPFVNSLIRKGSTKNIHNLGGIFHRALSPEIICIVLFYVSGHLEQFGGVLFFVEEINYFGGIEKN